MSTVIIGRKKPHCHSCGSPMEGHKRKDGLVICPSDARSTPLMRLGTSRMTEAEMNALVGVIPERGFWHRRNPNWTSDTPVSSVAAASSSSSSLLAWSSVDGEREHESWRGVDGESVVSTETAPSAGKSEYVDDGDGLDWNANGGFNTDDDGDVDTEQEEEEDDDDKASVVSGSSGASLTSLLDRVLASSEPLASVFAMPTHAIPRVRNAADKHGLHVGLFRSPHRPGWSYNNDSDDEDGKIGKGLSTTLSWWVVLGKNAQAVKHLMDIHSGNKRSKMPGTFSTDTTTIKAVEPMTMMVQKCSPSYTGFVQLLLASFIGGMIVLYGLSFL